MGLVEIYGLSNLYDTFKEDGIMLYLHVLETLNRFIIADFLMLIKFDYDSRL